MVVLTDSAGAEPRADESFGTVLSGLAGVETAPLPMPPANRPASTWALCGEVPAHRGDFLDGMCHPEAGYVGRHVARPDRGNADVLIPPERHGRWLAGTFPGRLSLGWLAAPLFVD
ncbi:hypothetical protein AB0K15_38475 [Amycolatopsis sp. NPDC049253]|uniref:hypothetical protein n=1 Tax=Amycolatopsis sp. NPDC049253 TaxID=3155274 RepID=UPI00341685F3